MSVCSELVALKATIEADLVTAHNTAAASAATTAAWMAQWVIDSGIESGLELSLIDVNLALEMNECYSMREEVGKSGDKCRTETPTQAKVRVLENQLAIARIAAYIEGRLPSDAPKVNIKPMAE